MAVVPAQVFPQARGAPRVQRNRDWISSVQGMCCRSNLPLQSPQHLTIPSENFLLKSTTHPKSLQGSSNECRLL